MAKKYRTKHDKMINSIIEEFGQLNAHDMVYAEELLIYSKMQKKLKKCLNHVKMKCVHLNELLLQE